MGRVTEPSVFLLVFSGTNCQSGLQMYIITPAESTLVLNMLCITMSGEHWLCQCSNLQGSPVWVCLVIKLDLLTSLLDRRDVGNSLSCYILISSYTMKVARMPWLKSWRYLPWCVKPTNYLWLKPGFPAGMVVVRGRALLALMETTWTMSACPQLMWHSTL